MATTPNYVGMSDEQLEQLAGKRPKPNVAGFVSNVLTGAGSRADAAQAEIQRRAEAAAAERGAARRAQQPADTGITFKKGGAVKARRDGVAQRGKTRGRMV